MSFDREFNKHFARTEKTVKRIGILAVFLTLLQGLFWLAIITGIVYFIAYAITHWLKW